MNKTAVEWLLKELDINSKATILKDLIKQAEEMENQQQDEFTIKFAEWKDINCIYYDGWNIRAPLGDKYNDVYTNEQLLEIFKNK